LDPELAQSDRQDRITLAGQAHFAVVEHDETIPVGERDGALARDVEAHGGPASADPVGWPPG
jgi:hypothetical protein